MSKYANSKGKVEIGISLANFTLLFKLDEVKNHGDTKTVCLDAPVCEACELVFPQTVRIRQYETYDAWEIKTLQIQKFPGSSKYLSYSLSKTEPRFLTDGDDNCLEKWGNEDLLPCCTNGRWCDLVMMDSDGNCYYNQ